MNFPRPLFLIAVLFIAVIVPGKAQVLQIFDGKDYNPTLWDDVGSIDFNVAQKNFTITTADGSFDYPIEGEFLFPSGRALPVVRVYTDEYLAEIPGKDDYVSGALELTGFGEYENVSQGVDIKGRGNSSWSFEKKPYRLKFDKKVSLCGLPKAKSYVLLASYTDFSLLQYSLACRLGRLLDLPYTHSAMPVDFFLNDIYKGHYILTNKPGINAGSVDIDEDNSVMWELDIYYDEDPKFESDVYNTPVMLADPDLSEEQFNVWKLDFNEMERAVASSRADEAVDLDNFCRYILVYEILKNDEIGWPKSVKMYKTAGQKYMFGPLWDFDLCMGKVWNGASYTTDKINDYVWLNPLCSEILNATPGTWAIMKEWWDGIKDALPLLLDFIDSYAVLIQESAKRNRSLWPAFEDFETSVDSLKNWLTLRFQAMSQWPQLQ